MPLWWGKRRVNRDDPDAAWRHLSTPASSTSSNELDADRLDEYLVDQEESLWVEPDYSTIVQDKDIEGRGPWHNWPGPPVIMPAGLLPDGKPWSGDEIHDCYRIGRHKVRNSREADAGVNAYNRQQHFLRDQAGIARPRRESTGLQDTPEAYAAIVEIHRQEKLRRRRLDRSRDNAWSPGQ